jgi:hypothetical protein
MELDSELLLATWNTGSRSQGARGSGGACDQEPHRNFRRMRFRAGTRTVLSQNSYSVHQKSMDSRVITSYILPFSFFHDSVELRDFSSSALHRTNVIINYGNVAGGGYTCHIYTEGVLRSTGSSKDRSSTRVSGPGLRPLLSIY